MLSPIDFSGRPFHFIGIGGIGMSALAYILAKRRLPVSGSDLRLNHITQRLQDLGVHIFWSQEATNLEFFQLAAPANGSPNGKTSSEILTSVSGSPGVTGVVNEIELDQIGSGLKKPLNHLPQVIVSTAINAANPEYQAALKLGCPIFHRSDLLAALMQDSHSIAVAGTHGKTTTSSLIGFLLLQSNLDPSIIVGGEVNAWGGNARLGEGPHLVAEADESDGSLVKLSAQIGVVTNIELDHPDHYSSLAEVVETFQTFTQRCQTFVGSIDCPTVRDYLNPPVTYSLHQESGADYTVDCVTYGSDGTIATVWERGQVLGQLHLQLLGRHNLSNSLAAIAVGRLVGLEFATIAQAISGFQGARRRFEYRGEYNGILFVDDYAHHPSEVQVTLAAARLQVNKPHTHSNQRRVVAIFQPHRYSRTLTFLAEFAQSFEDADLVVITDIYSAGEKNPQNISGQQVANAIATYRDQVYYQPSLQSVCTFLTQTLRPGDLAIFLGAGSVNQIIPDLMNFYQQQDQRLSQEWCNQA